ncbi:unnamed protein product [Zymoseptoria tritici ST99CH_1A5]|uniref:Peptidase A1 domain-containing protein n=3 Tax=Zymoseptoria tritici TaxID=1047171 RepID=F9WZF5_ZYMTI|nr:uncharacterized protein MYCGRDRAFT_107363 [Zymoseptoria tritici IPO323]EGP92211.1 hypothetical protein MYCGRDRAFT_107363 [Zymoseptoria tritici IPO323]SMR42527.1 unnamed protein product [Zymoseptoria tritici ST99CH_1E4]SMR44701.1 unnamed protein product [Zymoseptoria tritici ST99CH_3D1]SMY19865.1 unnamed protein product [Zymoseptoria tritici ST99CH_1A5]
MKSRPSTTRPASTTSTTAICTFLLLAAPHVASAFSFPALRSYTSSRASELLYKRADQNATTIPAAIEVAPSQYWDGIDGPWSSFPLQVGTAAQNIRVQPGTSSPVIATIAADGCPGFWPATCPNDRGFLFLPNESLTWVPNSIFQMGVGINLGLDTTTDAGFDTVTLGWQGTNGPTVQHSTIFNVVLPNYWIGIFGLRPQPSNFSTYRDPQPSFMQQLVNNNTIPSLSYGYTAGNQYRLNQVYGSLVLGGYDANRFDATKNLSIPMYQDTDRELLVNLQAITTDAGSPSNLLPDGAIDILIDSTFAPIYLPESACDAFEKAFNLTFDKNDGYYLVDDSQHDALLAQNANVTFKIGSQSSDNPVDIVLPYKAFDLTLKWPAVTTSPTNQSHYFPLKRAVNSTQYTLGRTFLQEAYIIVDYDKSNFTVAPCTWDAQKVAKSSIKSILRANETAAANDSGSGTPTAAIAGGVVGGLAGAALVLGAILFWLRRRKSGEKKRLAELEGKDANGVDKNSSINSKDGKPLISAPFGGELGGDGEIHEMNGAHKQLPQELGAPYRVDPNKHGYSEVGGGGEFFAPAKGVPAEMRQGTPIYEMAGSDVQELPASTHRPSMEKR